MSKIGIVQWLQQNGHKKLEQVPKEKIKVYELDSFVLEQWVVLNVPPISKTDAFDHKRFIFGTNEQKATPLFREYKEAVLDLLPDVSREELSYLYNNKFELLIEIYVYLEAHSYFKTMNLAEPFLRVLQQKYDVGKRDSFFNITIRKYIVEQPTQQQIKFCLKVLTPVVGGNNNINKAV